MQNLKKLTLLFFVTILLFATASFGDEPHYWRHAPIFPRGAKELKIEDRLNDNAKIAYSIMTQSDKAHARDYFIQRDHTDSRISEAQNEKRMKLEIQLTELFMAYFTKAIKQDLIVKPPKHLKYGGLRCKETIIDGVNFGVRYHLYVEVLRQR